VPTKPKTKSERIKELLDTGFSPLEVAEKLNTTIDYVYKEKGKLRKKGLLVSEQSITLAREGNKLTLVKGQPIDNHLNYSTLSGEDQIYGNSDLSPVKRDDLKSMYSCFEKKMDASEVVAFHGFRPDISEKEYNRFLSIKSRDPLEFQRSLISRIQNAPPEIQSLIDKTRLGILLTNSELHSIIDFKMQVYASQYLLEVVSNPKIPVPGLNRYICRYCHVPQPGVLFDKTSRPGNLLRIFSSSYICSNCKGIADEAYEGFKIRHPES
jgi:hypothetical protein